MADSLLARRALALGITSVLVGGGVPVLAHAALAGGGASAASAIVAAGPSNTGTSPTDGGYAMPGSAANPRTVSGTYDAPLKSTSTLVVRDASNSLVDGTTTVSGKTITFAPSQRFSDGAFTATVNAVNSAGDATSTVFSFTIDGTAPTAPTVDVPPATRDSLPVQGTGEPGDTVTITVSDGTNKAPGSATVGTNGAYSVIVPVGTLDEGTLTVTAIQTDRAGNKSSGSAAATTTTTRLRLGSPRSPR